MPYKGGIGVKQNKNIDFFSEGYTMSDPTEELKCEFGRINNNMNLDDNCDIEYYNKQGEKISVKNNLNNHKNPKSADKKHYHNEDNDKVSNIKDVRSKMNDNKLNNIKKEEKVEDQDPNQNKFEQLEEQKVAGNKANFMDLLEKELKKENGNVSEFETFNSNQ
jgi:hypothetical protein